MVRQESSGNPGSELPLLRSENDHLHPSSGEQSCAFDGFPFLFQFKKSVFPATAVSNIDVLPRTSAPRGKPLSWPGQALPRFQFMHETGPVTVEDDAILLHFIRENRRKKRRENVMSPPPLQLCSDLALLWFPLRT